MTLTSLPLSQALVDCWALAFIDVTTEIFLCKTSCCFCHSSNGHLYVYMTVVEGSKKMWPVLMACDVCSFVRLTGFYVVILQWKVLVMDQQYFATHCMNYS